MQISPDFATSAHIESRAQSQERGGSLSTPRGHEGKRQPLGLALALTDVKVWWLAGILTLITATVSSVNAYFPTLVKTIGYSPSNTLLLCIPPWVFTTCAALVVSG
jgi:hypothetical protein